MLCPHCPDTALVMSERQGVEIDYCPKCRGVWLDRGELDKIIERANAAEVAAPAPVSPAQTAAPREAQRPAPPPDFVDSDFHHRDPRYAAQRKRKSMWSELFDFD